MYLNAGKGKRLFGAIMKTIAVLMATYNGEKYLRTQIDSILNQNGNFELHLIVRDDGSTDSTRAILNEYQEKGLLSWYTGKNLKTAKNFMDLLYNHPDYDYYAFSDQDDFWLEGKIQKGIDSIENYKTPCLYFSNLEIVDSDLKPLGFCAHKKIPHYDFYSATANAGFAGCTFVFNKELAKIIQSKKIPEALRMHDAYMFKTCACVGSLVYDFSSYIKYRQHGDNVDGFPVNKFSALKNRIKRITKRKQVSASQEVKEIMDLYHDDISSEQLKWLELISNYRVGLNRFRLAFSNKIKYPSVNMKLTAMATILFGNY